jgi:DivIVA domain-containing protein
MGQYVLLLVVALTVGAVVFGVTVLVSGGDPGLGVAEPDGRAIPLPGTRPLVESDVATVRFDTAMRGYRMAQVDRAMQRAAYDIGYKDELISVLEAEVAALREGRMDDAEVLRRAREAALVSNNAEAGEAERDGTGGVAEPVVSQGQVVDETPVDEMPADDEPVDDEPVKNEPVVDTAPVVGNAPVVGKAPEVGKAPVDEVPVDEVSVDKVPVDGPVADEPAPVDATLDLGDEPAPGDGPAPVDAPVRFRSEPADQLVGSADPPVGSAAPSDEPAERGEPGQSGEPDEPADDQTGEPYPAAAERR